MLTGPERVQQQKDLQDQQAVTLLGCIVCYSQLSLVFKYKEDLHKHHLHKAAGYQ